MSARDWVVALTVAGTLLQIGVGVFGAWALRRSYQRAKVVVEAAMSDDPAQRPAPTTTYQHALYLREWLTVAVLEHSWKQASGGLGVLIVGAAMTTAAGVWGLYLPSSP